MGLDYSYMLYFKRSHLWKALEALGDMAELYENRSTIVHFPDHDLTLSLTDGFKDTTEIQYDAPEFSFAISLIFEEDEALLDYIIQRGFPDDMRAPPDPDAKPKYSIGYIYLDVFTDLSVHWAFEKPSDLVLFKFGTTGTRMSILFSESDSIRDSFCNLLKKVPGEYGVFDREMVEGELFWLQGQRLSEYIPDVYILPHEIEEYLKHNKHQG